ncbi:MAG: hypothetical protein RR543_05780 [Erysipelotrichales bacterium]
MNKFKKILGLFILVLLVVGCGSNNNKVKNEAIEAYVNKVNNVSKENINIELNTNLKIPKSALMQEEVDAGLKGGGIIDVKKNSLMFEIKLNDNKSKEKMDMKMYADKTYMYMFAEGQWFKSKLDAETKAALKFDEIAKEKTTVEDAKKAFGEDEDTKYEDTKVDGKDAYTITSKIGLEALTKTLKNEKSKESEEAAQALDMFKDMNLESQIVIFKDEKLPLKMNLKVSFDIMGVKVNIDPLTIDVNNTKNGVEIPAAAKKAPEMEGLAESAGVMGV